MPILILLCLVGVGIGTAAADAPEKPRTVRGYQNGRPVKVRVVEIDGVDVEVSTAKAFHAMRRAAAANGVWLRIASGFRTHERQGELYRAWRAGYGNRAARPGFSNHQVGRALDIDLDADSHVWLGAHARAHGFHRTVKGEPWHWEFLGVPRRAARPAKPAPARPAQPAPRRR